MAPFRQDGDSEGDKHAALARPLALSTKNLATAKHTPGTQYARHEANPTTCRAAQKSSSRLAGNSS
jgi:hypothetical protein